MRFDEHDTPCQQGRHYRQNLAVQDVNGEKEFVGSYDVLLQVHATRSGVWRRYNGMYGLVGVKLTGTSCAFGLNSNRMRMHLVKGRAVLLAA